MYFLGCQRGPVGIDKRMQLTGIRGGAPSVSCDSSGNCRTVVTDTGVVQVRRSGPLPSIRVDAGVNRLVLEGFPVGDGFRIR